MWIVCALTLVAEFFVHLHPYFEVESTYGFYSWVGLFGIVALVLGARALQVIVTRREGYYDE